MKLTLTKKTIKQILAVERDVNSLTNTLNEENIQYDTIFKNMQQAENEPQLDELRKQLRTSERLIKELKGTLALTYHKLAELKRLEASSYEYIAQDLEINCPLAL